MVQRQQEEVLGPQEEEVETGTELTRAQRRLLRRSNRQSPVLFGLIIFLVLLATAQAVVLIPLLDRIGGGSENGFENEVNLPEREIRVFVAKNATDLILKSPLDLPEADRERARKLDEHLFPSGESHRYYVLHAANRGKKAAVLDLADPSLLLEDSSGKKWSPLDLGSVVDRRSSDLPEYLRLYLRLHLPENGQVNLPAGTSCDVLLAYPGDLEPSEVARARLGGVVLKPEELRKDRLDRMLEMNGSGR